jgi:hypothetical protein
MKALEIRPAKIPNSLDRKIQSSDLRVFEMKSVWANYLAIPIINETGAPRLSSYFLEYLHDFS